MKQHAITISGGPYAGVRVTLDIPGDKSVSHRSIMCGALANGCTRISNFLASDDCLHTMKCFQQMGVVIERNQSGNEVSVTGAGLYGLKEPERPLYVGNSGTAIRLMLGLLAAQPFDTVITGDESICRRPMKRVAAPLAKMGAHIESVTGSGDDLYAPLVVYGNKKLQPITYTLPVASAQVKSAILLAGLYVAGTTVVVEPQSSRDHTERMLAAFGVPVTRTGSFIEITGPASLTAQDVFVPSDISSAAFFMVAGLILPGSCITLRNVGINPTRTGIIDVLRAMGGDIELTNIREEQEPVADIIVRSSDLCGTVIGGDMIPRLIDEIPIIAAAAVCASGDTVISDARELRYKETDRIRTVCSELSGLGAVIEEKEDGMVIHGSARPLQGAVCTSHGDHRIAMSCAILGLRAGGQTVIEDVECINTSFPEFFRLFEVCRSCGTMKS